MQVSYSATYSGFMMGPCKADTSWSKPCKKFSDRISMWQDPPTNLHWQTRIYNVLALSTLSYVWQLETPTTDVCNLVKNGIFRMAKGTGMYASIEDMWTLKESFGMPVSFGNVVWSAKAAEMRVFIADKGMQATRLARHECRIIEELWRGSNFGLGSPFFKSWYDRSFLRTLCDNAAGMIQQFGSVNNIRSARKEHFDLQKDIRWTKDIQRTFYEVQLAHNLPDLARRLRTKHKRLELNDVRQCGHNGNSARMNTPACMADRCARNLHAMSKVLPPRVQAATWGWIWNKWTTEKRTRQTRSNTCLLCRLPHTEDSAEHYCVCSVISDAMLKRWPHQDLWAARRGL